MFGIIDFIQSRALLVQSAFLLQSKASPPSEFAKYENEKFL